MAYTVGVAAMLLAFYVAPVGVVWLQWFTVFMIGFFLYGPQMLIGLCGAELVGPESVGASEGFLGWIAYLGAANAGIPLSIIVKVCSRLLASPLLLLTRVQPSSSFCLPATQTAHSSFGRPPRTLQPESAEHGAKLHTRGARGVAVC